MSKFDTIAMRERVTIKANAAPGGASNPDYSTIVGSNLPAEAIEVKGGEVVRGRQVEATTTHVVTLRYASTLPITAECLVLVLSGPHAGKRLYVEYPHIIDTPGRPRLWQLHCKWQVN